MRKAFDKILNLAVVYIFGVAGFGVSGVLAAEFCQNILNTEVAILDIKYPYLDFWGGLILVVYYQFSGFDHGDLRMGRLLSTEPTIGKSHARDFIENIPLVLFTCIFWFVAITIYLIVDAY
ncbi:hypothetical protein WH96_06235 [Kiloniella spongiae]|uniref:Uncharacterized protein n=1 Tax=Kiloniella spongiae TaxID=1489064 RepID=A0A0H2MYR1_9PROT|nr:hypothetical protein [Kiloniella spongiae]KLN61870.1 hypothetical protein WH96_06235 [Kiloniella spongiae]